MDASQTATADGARPSPARIAGAPAAVGEVLDGRWKISQIRRGGQAWVLVADDAASRTRRAIKIPLREGVIADDTELAMLLSIEPHPHVVSALDVTEIRGRRGIVMEYVPLTFGELQDRRDPAPVLSDATASVLQQVCTGLAHLSAATETAHLDLKPSNMLVDEAGQAKVADFGLAQPVQTRGGRFSAARGGTWAYAAPEVLRGESCDVRADIFSFGIVLYEACTGRLPYPFDFTGKSNAVRRRLIDYYASKGPGRRNNEIYYWDQIKQLTELPVAVPDDDINMLLSGCLMEHVEDRHRSFADLAPLLARAVRRPVPHVPEAAIPASDRQRRELALSRALIRLGQFDEAVARLNRLLASPLPEDLFGAVLQAGQEGLMRAGRHAEAAALGEWRLCHVGQEEEGEA